MQNGKIMFGDEQWRLGQVNHDTFKNDKMLCKL